MDKISTLNDLKNVLPIKLYENAVEAIKKHKLTDAQKKKVIEKIHENYLKSKFEAGEAFGMIAAQSISEPATQMTMRTYHVAGSVQIQVTLGLPRLVEIFDARSSPSTPSMIIYLKKEYQNKDKALEVAKEIKEVKLDTLSNSAIINLATNQIEIDLNSKMLKENKLTENKIIDVLKEEFPKCNIRSGKDKLFIKIKEETDVKELQKKKTKILEAHIKGAKDVSHALVLQKQGEWIINTLGTNLAYVLNVHGVDSIRTTSNNIHEVEKVLGIEAARETIIREASNTLEDQGLDVDIRHIMLVADVMTAEGRIRPIGRYGIAGSKGSVIARANFEETIKHLTNAALEGQKDNLESIVENVAINQIVPAGTGMVNVGFKLPDKKQFKD